MKLSIVSTLYKSESYIKQFYERISSAAEKVTPDFELIFVNDGSPDASLDLVIQIQRRDSRVIVIDLSRNFGHHRAIMTGLSYARGQFVFLIDCDLEEDPELLLTFWEELRATSNLDVVYGYQRARKGGLFEKFAGAMFIRILNWLSDVEMTENEIVVRLMSRQFVQNLIRHQERELVFVGVAQLTGFMQKALPVSKKHRGGSTYTLRKKLALTVNTITSLSSKPLEAIFYFGLLVTLISSGCFLYIFSRKLLFGVGEVGWSSLIVSIWFFGGLLVFCVGIVGMYLSKIFLEVKQRPYSIVKHVYGHGLDKSAEATLGEEAVN